MPSRRIRGRLRPLTLADRRRKAERNERRGRVDVSPSTARSIHAPKMKRARITDGQVETAQTLGQRSLRSFLGRRFR